MEIDYIGKCLLINVNGKRILAIGDLHLGYNEGLIRKGVLVPGNSFEEIVRELEEVLKKTGDIDEVVLLGDLKHEFGKILDSEWREIKELLDFLKKRCGKIIIVRGNHDKITEIVTEKKGLEIVDNYVCGEMVFLHGDKDFVEIYDKKIKCWVMGHGHPAVRISDGVKEEKYKCFLVGKYKKKDVVIVPSFFDINLGTDARDYDLGMAWDFDLGKFEVKVVEGLEVLNFGELRKLS